MNFQICGRRTALTSIQLNHCSYWYMCIAGHCIVMRPSSLGGGRILRRTLSVRLSVRPVIVAIGNVFSSTASVTDVLFSTH